MEYCLATYKSEGNGTWTIPDNPQTVYDELQQWAARERQRASNAFQDNALAERRRLIIAFCTWDIMRVNLRYLVSKGLAMIRSFLEDRRADHVLSKVKIVLATISAAPEHDFKDTNFANATVHYCLRNNAALAAINRMLIDTVQTFDDVSVADRFAISVHRTVQAYDDIHYVRQFEPVPLLSATGVAMTRHLIEKVCE